MLDRSIVLLFLIVRDRGITVRIIIGLLTLTELFKLVMLTLDNFDSDKYSREEAEAQFKPYQGINQRCYPYTGYEYGGDKFYDYKYVGEFEDRYAPRKPKEVNYYNWKNIFGK